jgi:hypothetical protein
LTESRHFSQTADFWPDFSADGLWRPVGWPASGVIGGAAGDEDASTYL